MIMQQIYFKCKIIFKYKSFVNEPFKRIKT